MPDLELRSGGLRLVARHDPPQGPPRAGRLRAAVVCHPHPLFGGTLENKVVHGLARALREHGLHALRFNFRGAGGSEGRHDEGGGEQQDVRAALDAADALAGPGPPDGRDGSADGRLLVAGYSFGSWVGLSVGLDDPRVGALIAVAPPVDRYDYRAIAATTRPLLVVYARDDELVPAALVERFIAGCARPPTALALPTGGHMLHGQIAALRGAVGNWLAGLG
ncbi:MAG TPA: alpha/beta hydrolase [Planctomycetota bacterium]|nr:alpha/beta hydrolase [Planctomycetota bacterium]